MKKLLIAFSLSACLVTLAGCKWNVPEKVSVKTNAEYNFTVGKMDKDLSDKVNLGETLKSSLSANNAKIYDYFPGENETAIQKYLMKMPIKDIELDFSKYFDNMNVAKDLEGLSHTQSFTVPNVSGQTATSTVGLSGIQTALNTFVSTVLSTSNYAGNSALLGVEYASVTYSAGSKIEVTSNTRNHGKTVQLKNSSGHIVASTTQSGDTSILDIGGKEILNDDVILIDGNPANNSDNGVTITGIPVKVTGFTRSTPFPVNFNKSEVPVGSDTFKSAIIDDKSGSEKSELQISFSGVTGWSGVTVDYDIKASGGISDASGNPLSITESGLDITTTPGAVSLKDDILLPKNIAIEPNGITLTVSNATMTFAASNPSIKINSAFTVTKLSSMTAKYDGNVTVSKQEALSDDITSMVKKIKLDPSGLTGKYTNKLPSGNTITLKTKSSFFDIEDTTKANNYNEYPLVANKIDEPLSITGNQTEVDITKDDPSTAGVNEATKVDFDAVIELPGWNATDKTITLSSITPGETYTISIDLKPAINWTSVVVDATNYNQTSSINTGLNLNSMLGSLTSSLGSDVNGKLSIKSLPIYLYCSKPEAGGLAGTSFKGTIKMFYQDVTNNATTNITEGERYLLGSAASKAAMPLVNLPTFVFDDTNSYIKEDIGTSYSAKDDIAPLTKVKIDSNTYPNASIAVSYDLAIAGGGELEITKTQMSSGSTSSINITALIVLPLEFEVSDAIEFNVMSMMGMDTGSDLMGRSEAMNTSTIDKYMNAISSVTFNYNCDELPIASNESLKLKVNMIGTDEYAHEYNFKSGSMVIDYNEINAILGTYPLCPQVSFEIPTTTFSIPREIKISAAFGMNIKTDGTVSFDFGGNE